MTFVEGRERRFATATVTKRKTLELDEILGENMDDV